MATANANSKSASTSPLGLILAAPFTVILLLAFVLMPIWLPIYYVIGKASFALREKIPPPHGKRGTFYSVE